MKFLACLALAGLLFFAGEAQAQLFRQQEVHALPSVTLSDTDFLNGHIEKGRPVMLGALLRLPKQDYTDKPDKFPAVVLLGGSGGLQGSNGPIESWMKEIVAMGYAVLAIDSLTGRGLVEAFTDLSRLGQMNLIIDAFRGLELLATHRQIDPQRIVLMGISRGGMSSTYAGVKRFHDMYAPKTADFIGYVTLYGSCGVVFHDDEKMVPKPNRIFHGGADDWTFASSCENYVKRLKAAGNNVEITVYPGVHHVFDAPWLQVPIRVADAMVTAKCDIVEGEKGRLMNRATGKEYTYKDACITRGATVGYSAEATNQTRGAVTAFLKKLFAK
jgi:dienelactone hydrolase